MKRSIIALCVLVSAVTSCKVDTYPLPSETLTGKVECADGSTFLTEQPNGFRIRLDEVVDGKITNFPQYFWGKPDGSFRNTRIFKGTYIVQPVEGAFLEVDPVEVEISGETELVFSVTPNLTINASITTSGPDVIAKYRITKADGAGKIMTARLLISKWNPNVGMNHLDMEAVRDLSGVKDETIVTTTYTDSVLDCLEPGVTYYVRIAALASNTSGRYNFSEVVKIEM